MLIRRWELNDKNVVVPQILAYLHETKDDYDYKPTQENAEFLWHIGFADFGVLATNGIVVGWANAMRTDDRFKKRIAYGMGTYVTPEYRGKGIATVLNNDLAKRCALAGFQRIDRVAATESGERMLEASGLRQIGRVFTRDLDV